MKIELYEFWDQFNPSVQDFLDNPKDNILFWKQINEAVPKLSEEKLKEILLLCADDITLFHFVFNAMEHHQQSVCRSDNAIISMIRKIQTNRLVSATSAFVKDANEMLRKHNNQKLLDKNYLKGFWDKKFAEQVEQYIAFRYESLNLDVEEFQQLISNISSLEDFIVIHRASYTPMGEKEKFRQIARPLMVQMDLKRNELRLGTLDEDFKAKLVLENKLDDEYRKSKEIK